MTVADLRHAVITVSDNTAANLLFDVVGGPPAVTAFVRGLGDRVTRSDPPEPALNVSTGPGDEGDGLDAAGRDRLAGWMLATTTTTGDAAVRAGVRAGWRVGAQGERNDIAVLWPPDRAPIVDAVYTAPHDPKSEAGDATIAAATRAVVTALG